MKLSKTCLILLTLVNFGFAQENTGDPIQDNLVVNAGKEETTQFGVKINNTDSLTAGHRGPTLLEDFMNREKIMHFDHERIPERVVHARGFGVHGYFEPYADWSNITAAKFLREPGKKTPVFVRFSTVLGSRGSPDTVRDVRGFATRFYTEEGNFDLVGNIIAPFFIQDAIKFPDLIHATKPEPDREVPQASTAHCTAYDFFSQHTESIHTVMWVLSGRGIIRSFRQVEGFGVHTFRLIREDKKTVFVKFIWKPLQGLSNLVWDEAQKIQGKDIDFHRNEFYDAIEKGDYPEYELCVQIVPEEDEDKFDFDLLDSTKIIPESLVPVTRLGKMTLNRNVNDFFSETEQVTYHMGHVVRGITFTDDPLLHGRLFSYLDTQINRMNSVNYFHLPINKPRVPVHNNQRDGYMQTNVHTGKVAYYPNTLQDNTPEVVSDKKGGYLEYPEHVNGTKQRGKAGKFADHFSHAQLFYNSLTTAEQQQVVNAARFELGKCPLKSVRTNMVNVFNRVDHNFARRVAYALDVPIPEYSQNKNKTSIGLSIENYPLPKNIKAKKVAIITAPGIDVDEAKSMYDFLKKEGAYPDYIGIKLGDQDGLDIEQTFLTTTSVLYDAVYVPSGSKAAFKLLAEPLSTFPYAEPIAFLLDAFRHGKPIAASGRGVSLLKSAQVPSMALSSNVESQKKYGIFISNDLKNLKNLFKLGIRKQRFWIRLPSDPDAAESPTPPTNKI
ncbi:catalase-like domain-containing protein [Cokeromyces recurvatus]|uniref:catalase-like domain-containing protein n=1 Tax=Cokeromyces recurvatus TaxID=90255 RepID=UPI00222067B8|nr:catalase-like domain-containing protein [Cokeromyces recurvatus]KAI7900246.1 catalase-like domain-containing protein [Cokeromyces recurvatus]